MFFPDPVIFPSRIRIQDPAGQKNPGSRIRIRNILLHCSFSIVQSDYEMELARLKEQYKGKLDMAATQCKLHPSHLSCSPLCSDCSMLMYPT